LNLESDEKQKTRAYDMIFKKLKPVFQEYNKNIFTFEDIPKLIEHSFKPKAIKIVEAHNNNEFGDDLIDNIESSEFESLIKIVLDLNLHMVLNDPPITLDLVQSSTRTEKTSIIERFEFQMYMK
jgi:hypothetical protein